MSSTFNPFNYIENPFITRELQVAKSCPTVEIFCDASRVFPPPLEAGRPRDIFADYKFVTSPPPPLPLVGKGEYAADDEFMATDNHNGAGASPAKRGRIQWQEVNGISVNGDHDFTIPVPRTWKIDSERKYWIRKDGKLVCAQPCGKQSWPTPECRKVVTTAASRDRHDGTHLKGTAYYCKPYGCLCEIQDGRVYTRVENLKKHLLEVGQMKKAQVDKIAKNLVHFERMLDNASLQKENKRG